MKRMTVLALFLLAALLAGCSGGTADLASETPPATPAGFAEKDVSAYANVGITSPDWFSVLDFTATASVTPSADCRIWYVEWQLFDQSGNPLPGKSWLANSANYAQYIDGSGLGLGWYILKVTAIGDDLNTTVYEQDDMGSHWIWVRK